MAVTLEQVERLREEADLSYEEARALLEQTQGDLLEALLDIAQDNLHTIMPGYTHLQKAQPITLAFHLMAYAQMFMRDVTRFEHAYDEADDTEEKAKSGYLKGVGR